MSEKHQALRLSQFILSQGPGSVLETPSGPVVISSLDRYFTSLGAQVPGGKADPENFEVTEQRLTQSALGGARIVRLPTNDEVGIPSADWVYPTEPFPLWSVCTKHGAKQVLYRYQSRSDIGCSLCGKTSVWECRAKAGREAIRFVRACENGHLDDVDWHWLVHGRVGCRGTEFIWTGAGRSLRQSYLKCSSCTAEVNFGAVYMRPLNCRGRRPELGLNNEEACTADARIVQRGASNLHVPVHQTALTLGGTSQRLHQQLSDANIRIRFQMLIDDDELNEEKVRKILSNEKVPITPVARMELVETSWERLHQAIREVFGLDAIVTGDDGDPIRDTEFEFLARAAVTGVPAIAVGGKGAPPMLEIHKDAVKRISAPHSTLGIRVTPINRLRVVIAQTGYERLGGSATDVKFQFGASYWVPGVELFGEGVFIDLPDQALPLPSERAGGWRALPRDPKCQTDPVFVWWHTLSHRLIRALSIDSGYSSASIRERIYFTKSATGEPRGGALLYTVQPGGDGTLGGLVEMAKRFEEVLEGAVEDLDNCSNDPLCEESELHNSLGAVCYSCLLASETSCEWRNRGLDRLLLRDCLP